MMVSRNYKSYTSYNSTFAKKFSADTLPSWKKRRGEINIFSVPIPRSLIFNKVTSVRNIQTFLIQHTASVESTFINISYTVWNYDFSNRSKCKSHFSDTYHFGRYVTFSKLTHPRKASSSISTTPSGITISLSPLHQAKDRIPIFLRFFGSTTSCSFVIPSKVRGGRMLIFSLTMIVVPSLFVFFWSSLLTYLSSTFFF